ncbi:hypothetical protein EK21DRAFT_115694 [Setomelanomma holmii]|uniref:DUF7029 domain-containing protein n=1 Tax=Setomelanomma holmii TaxID=210430 RepID=A0A9P4H2P8_9PLEO|nr:hypothetical protein EK21DRAFT_115694 [Setomelanomma holmii]
MLTLENGGLVVASHYGCNTHGERSLFRVGNVDGGQQQLRFVLHTTPASWETSFKSIGVKMYHTLERHNLRSHNKPLRRQELGSRTSTRVDNRPTYALPEPTATSAADVNTLDLNHGLINEFLIGSANSSLQITCKNCFTYGSLDFSFAQFCWAPNATEIFEPPIALGVWLDGGEMTIVAHRMGARVEILTNITGNATMDVPLFEIPLIFGIPIRVFGAIGLLYAPTVHVDYALNGSIAFIYGFETDISDKSRLFIDMTDPTNSTITGFDETTITEISFQASVDVNTARIDVFLRHQVQAGLFFDKFGTGVGVGVYLDLPKYRAEFEKV